ncbi:MAG TPA: cyclic nucleotide-binding domain-containing protein [Thermomicrobiales bacterium]|jgi:CRP-like cAMP-binding protein
MSATIDFLQREGEGQTFAAGQTIFSAGDPGDVMYVVSTGEAEVVIDGRAVETVGTGGIFGEMALIDAQPRSATVVAKTDCLLMSVDGQRFERLVSHHPRFALQMMRILTQRIRNHNG